MYSEGATRKDFKAYILAFDLPSELIYMDKYCKGPSWPGNLAGMLKRHTLR